MTTAERKMYDALVELTKKFDAVWSNVYFMSLSTTFCINIPAISQHEISHLDNFCKEHNLTWVIMREHSKDGKGINISFYPVV